MQSIRSSFREQFTRADIKVAIVGLRNLTGKCKDMTIKASLLGVTTAIDANKKEEPAIKEEIQANKDDKKNKAKQDKSDNSELEDSESDQISSEDEEDNLRNKKKDLDNKSEHTKNPIEEEKKVENDIEKNNEGTNNQNRRFEERLIKIQAVGTNSPNIWEIFEFK